MGGKPPGSRNKLSQFTKPECDYFREHCNFTPDETAVFDLRAKDKSVVHVCFALGMSEATVYRTLRRIMWKISKVT